MQWCFPCNGARYALRLGSIRAQWFDGVVLRWCYRWACGVLIFEMAAGYPPFYHEDRVTMFRNISQVKYTCPVHFSKVSLSFLSHVHAETASAGQAECVLHPVPACAAAAWCFSAPFVASPHCS